tara:strand:+ start:1803 stop:2516 length:714 start_codon:yes stop_codon:yes gene_type:complete
MSNNASFDNLDFLIHKYQDSKETLTSEDINLDFNYNILMSYLTRVISIYKKIVEVNKKEEDSFDMLKKESALLEKKISINSDVINDKEEEIRSLSIEKKKKKGLSFFDSLQSSNEYEVAIKKKNILSEEIKVLKESNRKTESTKATFLNLNISDNQNKIRNLKSLVAIILDKLFQFESEFKNISKSDYQIIRESTFLIDYKLPTEQIILKKNNKLLASYVGLGVPIVSLLIIYLLGR